MSGPAPAPQIRRCQSVADYQACQIAQRSAWGITEEGYVVPIATLVGAQLHGGLVLALFLPDGQAVGLSFAFLARIGSRFGLYSQLTGVIPAYQGLGIGEQLKHAQRRFAREDGLPVIAWAFDPLQSGNAHFNLARLGATATRYVENMYGPRTDALNANTPTDRLIAEWDTYDQPPNPNTPSHVSTPRLITVDNRTNIPAFSPTPLQLNPPRHLLLEIPPRIADIRRDSPPLAEAWRHALHAAFTAAFSAGYAATSFTRQPAPEGTRHFYVLTRQQDPG